MRAAVAHVWHIHSFIQPHTAMGRDPLVRNVHCIYFGISRPDAYSFPNPRLPYAKVRFSVT